MLSDECLEEGTSRIPLFKVLGASRLTRASTQLLSSGDALGHLSFTQPLEDHLPTCQTFDDAIIAGEGLMLYILSVTADNSYQHFIPWLITSDACEQTLCFPVHRTSMQTLKLICVLRICWLAWANQTVPSSLMHSAKV